MKKTPHEYIPPKPPAGTKIGVKYQAEEGTWWWTGTEWSTTKPAKQPAPPKRTVSAKSNDFEPVPAPTTSTESNGVTYVIPHPALFAQPNYAVLEHATDWERQETSRLYRTVQSSARRMIGSGIYWLERINRPEGPQADNMNASGGSIPQSGAIDLTIALVELTTHLDGIRHRIAMSKKENEGS